MSDKINNDPENLPWLGRKLLWVDNPANVKRIFQALIIICVALFATDFIYSRHGILDFEHYSGFYGIFGFIAFCVVIFGAKGLRTLIKRDENYYAPHVVDTEEYPDHGLDKVRHVDD